MVFLSYSMHQMQTPPIPPRLALGVVLAQLFHFAHHPELCQEGYRYQQRHLREE
jgi:hypothetical protein